MLCGITVESGKGPAQVTLEGTTWWPPHTTSAFLASLSETEMGTCSCPQQGLAWGWRDQPFSVSALNKGCYFSCHVCWGPAQVCFSCRKAGRPIWNTHNSHVIDDDLAQRLALALWQLKGTGWVSPAASTEEQGKGGRMQDSYLLGLLGPSILSPCTLLPQGTSGFSSHNLLSGEALLVGGRLHFLSTSSSYWMREEASHPKEGKSLDQQRSMQAACGRQKQEEVERAFSILGPRQSCCY